MRQRCVVCGLLFIIILAALSIFISSCVSSSGFHTTIFKAYKPISGSSNLNTSLSLFRYGWLDEVTVSDKKNGLDNSLVDGKHSDKVFRIPTMPVSRHTRSDHHPISLSSVVSVTSKATHTSLFIRERFKKRRSFIRSTCQKMGLWKKPLTMTETRILHYNMLVDDKHRILYCFLPKAACTSWKKVFQVLTGKAKSTKEISGKNAHDQKRLTFLKDFSSSEALKRLSGYRKMMVHREPMMRFISAYISKFVVPDWYFVKKFGTQILKLYRKDASKESLATGKGVRFEEFSRYIADNAHKALHFDGHWKPAAFQCQPCYVDYDYVSSTDTADEDADVILDLIGANGKVTFPHDNKSRHTSVIQQYFSKLSRAVVKKLIEVYRRDFTLFGYKRPNVKDLVYHNASLSIR